MFKSQTFWRETPAFWDKIFPPSDFGNIATTFTTFSHAHNYKNRDENQNIN